MSPWLSLCGGEEPLHFTGSHFKPHWCKCSSACPESLEGGVRRKPVFFFASHTVNSAWGQGVWGTDVCRCGCINIYIGCTYTRAAILSSDSVGCSQTVKFLEERRSRTHQGHPGFFLPPPLAPSIDVTSHPPLSFPLGDWGSRNMPSKNISTVVPSGTMQNRTEGVSRKWKSQPNPHRCRPFLLRGKHFWLRPKATQYRLMIHPHTQTQNSQYAPKCERSMSFFTRCLWRRLRLLYESLISLM